MSIDLYVDFIPRSKLPDSLNGSNSNKIPLVLFTHIDQKSFKYV